MIPKVNNNQV